MKNFKLFLSWKEFSKISRHRIWVRTKSGRHQATRGWPGLWYSRCCPSPPLVTCDEQCTLSVPCLSQERGRPGWDPARHPKPPLRHGLVVSTGAGARGAGASDASPGGPGYPLCLSLSDGRGAGHPGKEGPLCRPVSSPGASGWHQEAGTLGSLSGRGLDSGPASAGSLEPGACSLREAKGSAEQMLQEGRARAQAGRWDRFTILCPPGPRPWGR